MAYKFNNALRHLTSNKHSLSTNTSFRKLHSSNISFSRSNSPPLSEEEDELLKISINEYKDLFPKIIQIPHNEFISTLERYIIISLKGKLSFPSGSLSKILSIIKHKYYEPDYIKIKSYITQTSSSLLKLDNCAMYIPHCLNNKTSKHKCGNALYFISPSHLFCKSCNVVYTTSSFSLYCEYCKVEYYTTLLDKQAQNKQFKQATWNKYHCDVLFVQPMKCPKCKDVLYINTKNNKLTCLECKYEFEQDKIISRCVVCNDNFVSEVKVYNSIEYKNVALAIKEAIFNSKEARPDYLPCCNTKGVVVDEMKFVHKKECNGVLYEGKLNDKRIVVCSCCHLLSYRENHFWMCPICKERFKLDANYVHDKDIGMYRKINVNKQIANNAGSRIRKDIRIGRGRYNSEIITEDNYNTSLLNRQCEGNVQSQGNNNNNNSRDNYNSNNNNTSGNVVNNRSGILHARYLSIFNSKLNNSNNNNNNNNNNNSANVNVSDALRENSPTPSSLNMKKINPLYIKHYKDKPNINIPEHKHYHHLSQLNSNYHTDTPKMSIETPMKLERHSIAPNPSVSAVSNNPNLRSSRFNIQSKRENSNQLLCSFLERSQHNASSNININFNVNITANNMIINNSSLLHKNRPLTEANTNSKFNSDQYTIIKQIGEGTFGKIYEVKNKYNKHFAMKKILTSNPHDIEALSDEYKMLISLNNLTLHLVKIFGMHSKQLDKTTYVMYVLMELASYDWEKEICNRKTKNNFYTEKELMHILKQLSITLAELQLRKISHRDIKPQNILIFNENVYKIADFGEAKTNINYSKSNYNVKDTTTQTIRGTELYMSPLLFKALKKKKMTRDKYIEHNTYKSDVFSLGLCMFLASTLNMQSLVDIREIDMTSSIKLIVNRWLKGRYSKRYVDILMKMLEVNEKKRVDFIELKNEVMNYIN